MKSEGEQAIMAFGRQSITPDARRGPQLLNTRTNYYNFPIIRLLRLYWKEGKSAILDIDRKISDFSRLRSEVFLKFPGRILNEIDSIQKLFKPKPAVL